MNEVNITEQVNLDEIKPIETISIDLKKHDKKEVLLERADVLKVKSNYSKTGFQWVLKISSEVVETLGENDDKVEFRATELFNLIQDENGNLTGFPTGNSTNLYKFAKDIGVDINVKHLGEFIVSIHGKKALIKAYEKESEGKTKTYLKFRY